MKNKNIITKEITKENNKVDNIIIYLFLQKINKYEPGIFKLIGFFHDSNYQYLKYTNYLSKTSLKLNICMGNYYINNDDIDSCICSNCDPDGFNILKPYRISHKLQ